MTRAEYLESIQEGQLVLANQRNAEAQGMYAREPHRILFDTPEVCRALARAHEEYCATVARIFGISLEYQEAGGPGTEPTILSTFERLLDANDPYDMER